MRRPLGHLQRAVTPDPMQMEESCSLACSLIGVIDYCYTNYNGRWAYWAFPLNQYATAAAILLLAAGLSFPQNFDGNKQEALKIVLSLLRSFQASTWTSHKAAGMLNQIETIAAGLYMNPNIDGQNLCVNIYSLQRHSGSLISSVGTSEGRQGYNSANAIENSVPRPLESNDGCFVQGFQSSSGPQRKDPQQASFGDLDLMGWEECEMFLEWQKCLT